MKKTDTFAELIGVEYNKEEDRVFIKFEVFDEKYKDFALRVAGRDDITLNFVGEILEIELDEEKDEDPEGG